MKTYFFELNNFVVVSSIMTFSLILIGWLGGNRTDIVLPFFVLITSILSCGLLSVDLLPALITCPSISITFAG